MDDVGVHRLRIGDGQSGRVLTSVTILTPYFYTSRLRSMQSCHVCVFPVKPKIIPIIMRSERDDIWEIPHLMIREPSACSSRLPAALWCTSVGWMNFLNVSNITVLKINPIIKQYWVESWFYNHFIRRIMVAATWPAQRHTDNELQAPRWDLPVKISACMFMGWLRNKKKCKSLRCTYRSFGIVLTNVIFY